ncbi:MAG: hypothetical protein HON07_06000 [Planctomycetaceae bacterium]|nr:hypothetical protein [Planctomycetaceae bacterium]MBT7729975.1 hypothetical protein [Planctomycetaceae bacterium]
MNRQESSSDIAWQDGSFLPRHQLSIAPSDAGFVLGATVTEQLRTIQGKLFRADAHAERLSNSLYDVGMTPHETITAIFSAADHVATHNHQLLTKGGRSSDNDLGVIIFVTPGLIASQNGGLPGKPSVTIHTFPLAFNLWADAYESGTSLRCVTVQQVPKECWSITAKVRSRLHYFLADQEASAYEKGCKPLLAHADGRISETSTANIAVLHGKTITTPPREDALPGISMDYLKTLSEDAGFQWETNSLRRENVLSADEVFLTSTPWCLLAVARVDGDFIGPNAPGPVFRRLLRDWSANVGLDLSEQALHRKNCSKTDIKAS